MSTRVLYWISGSPPAWRANAMLFEKQLEFESKRLNASEGEHKSDEVLAINPRGQVPTFKDGDIIVNESMAILQYIEETYPEPALLPSDKADRAQAYQRFHETASIYVALQPLFDARQVGKVGTDTEKEKFRQDMARMHKEAAFFDSYLRNDQEFLAGNMFTIADICLATTIFFAQRSGATFEKHPNLAKYAQRMSERPCFKETWPPHWSETPDSNWLDGL